MPYPCPKCDSVLAELRTWKRHMSMQHGGWSPAELEAVVEATRPEPAPEPEPAAEAQPEEAPRPRRSARPPREERELRELNLKIQEALALAIEHLVSGLDPAKMARLVELRGEITTHAVGFSFEPAATVRLQSRFWLVLLILFLWLAPHAETLRRLAARRDRSDRSDRVREDDAGSDDVP